MSALPGASGSAVRARAVAQSFFELNQLHRPGSTGLLVSAGAGAVPSRTTSFRGFAEQLQPLPRPEELASLLELVRLNRLLPCGAVQMKNFQPQAAAAKSPAGKTSSRRPLQRSPLLRVPCASRCGGQSAARRAVTGGAAA